MSKRIALRFSLANFKVNSIASSIINLSTKADSIPKGLRIPTRISLIPLYIKPNPSRIWLKLINWLYNRKLYI